MGIGKCPHCEQPVFFGAMVAPEQRMEIRVKLGDGVPWFSASEIAAVVGNTSKALEAVAKNLGGKIHVTVESISLADGELNVVLLALDVVNTKGGAK